MASADANGVFIKIAPFPHRFQDRLYGLWLKVGVAKYLKARRVRAMGRAMGIDFDDSPPLKICEVGCGSGRDFISAFAGSKHTLWGVDQVDFGLRQDGFTFVQSDAATMPFPDKFFDVIVSFGVLEHIEPIERLAQVAREIDRIAVRYAVIVPCISTLIEPHLWGLFWQLRPVRKLVELNYFADMAWLKFTGFAGARVTRFGYIPGLITNLIIAGSPETTPLKYAS